MKALLIAEKPSLMRTIQEEYRGMKDYPYNITFSALVGHVLTLQYPADYKKDWEKWSLDILPIIPEEFKFKVVPKTEDVYMKVKRELESEKYDFLINACDAGREGQNIFYSIYDHLGCELPVKRFWTADLSPKGVQDGLNNLLDDNSPKLSALKQSAKLRSHFDWIQGMNLSRAVTLKTGVTVSIGRVMTPTLAIIVNRQKEIEKFGSKVFHELVADFGDYTGLWYSPVNNGTRFLKMETVEKLRAKILENKEGKIAEVEKKEQKKYPFKLHSLNSLQREANTVYGYTASKTLEIAQSLYQDRKLITYPRTDSEYLPVNIALGLKDQLKNLQQVPKYGNYIVEILKDEARINQIKEDKKYVDDSKVSDHFAIIPTNVKVNYEKLTNEEANIYNLVVRRLTAIFMDPEITEKTTIITSVGEDSFKTTGTVLKDEGFMVLYPKKTNDIILPSVEKDQLVNLLDIQITKGKTTPPSKYSEAKLLELMENIGRIIEDEDLKSKELRLGTPATSGEIIEKLIAKNMMKREGRGKTKNLVPTEFGIDIISALEGFDITSPELTAVWEKKLTNIESLELDAEDFRREMIDYSKKTTEDIIRSVNMNLSKHNVFKPTKNMQFKRDIVGKCPKCGKPMLLSDRYIRCDDYKKSCDMIISRNILGARLDKEDCRKFLNMEETSVKDVVYKNGKDGKVAFKLKDDGSLDFIFK